MKLFKNTSLYSRLSLIISLTLVTGYAIVFAWTTLDPLDAGTGKPLTATLMQGIVNNVNELNTNLWTVTGKFGLLESDKWCTSDGTKINCTSTAPIAGGTSLWSTGASDSISYTAGTVGVWSVSGNAELDIRSGTKPHWGIYHDETTEQLRFWNGANRVVFSSGGSVGIGTTSPGAKLDVNQGNLKISSTGQSTGTWIDFSRSDTISLFKVSNAGSANGDFVISGDQWGGFVDRLAIQRTTGNVGIGTVSPGRLLQLNKTDVTTYSSDFDQSYNLLKFTNPDTTIGSAVGMQFLIGTNREASIQALSTADGTAALSFGTRGGGVRSEKMRINGNGNVGIGTTTPSDTLTVNGGVTATNFTSPTGWTSIPSSVAGWTSYASCRRIGSFLQINWSFYMTVSGVPWWNSTVATLPVNCRPSLTVSNVPGTCWNASTITSACFSTILTDGAINILTSSTIQYFSLTGTYPAN